jgi:hypothetical protein
MRYIKILGILGAMLLLGGQASAQILNAGFDSGGANWTPVTGSGGSASFPAGPPTRGSASTPDSIVTATKANLEAELLASLVDLNTVSTNVGHNGGVGTGATFSGAGFFQDFTATVDGTVGFTFSHNLDTRGLDLAFASLVDTTGAPVLVTPTAGADTQVFSNLLIPNPVAAGFMVPLVGDSGTWNIVAGRTYRIGFGIINEGDDTTTANFSVDLITTTATVPEINPESGMLPLAALFLVLLGLADGRRRRLIGTVES